MACFFIIPFSLVGRQFESILICFMYKYRIVWCLDVRVLYYNDNDKNRLNLN